MNSLQFSNELKWMIACCSVLTCYMYPKGAHRLGVSSIVPPFHRLQNQLLRLIHALQNNLQIHGRFIGLPNAGAIDAVLANQHERVGQQVRGHGEFAARAAHLEFVPFKLFVIHVFLSILVG